ncbi:MAG: hypothetical protein LBV69_04905 [Bacteroidales bacterium]|jgi:hypothetical protein|nr:hypothetical protein [Bacteroidales bacterium]
MLKNVTYQLRDSRGKDLKKTITKMVDFPPQEKVEKKKYIQIEFEKKYKTSKKKNINLSTNKNFNELSRKNSLFNAQIKSINQFTN